MAVNKEKKLLELFQQLPETEQNSTLDFVEYLAERQRRNTLQQFYDNLPEVDEPFSQEELDQLNNKEGFITGEAAKREFNLDLP
ncbi:DUF2281 domain-containing protein [Paenibacillus jiagnxiensis]|uniref:DUF2281 domain-containing protein n=1 Tax=Paenibacillus jiagnxiensis TaxID=3228926 RepID=UPI0033AB1850